MKNKLDYNNVTIKIFMDNRNILGTKIRVIINMSMRTKVEKFLKTIKSDEFLPINTLKTKWKK